MQTFDHIYQRALKRKGSTSALNSLLPEVRSRAEIEQLTDDRFLSEMTRCIFQAGFVWRVINLKWDGFEEAFFNFIPLKMLLLSPEQIEKLGQDTRIVRNMQKIISVPKNAQFITDIVREHQGEHHNFAEFIAAWPSDNIIGLLDLMKKRGNRLGGMTGTRVLRNLGVDTFVLTADVIQCLQLAGVDIKNTPTSKADLLKIQTAFNTWQQQSKLPLAHISRICACSVGENYIVDAVG